MYRIAWMGINLYYQRSFQLKITPSQTYATQCTYKIILSPFRTVKPCLCTGGTCSYECKNTGACSVTLKPNGSYSGGIKGSCTSEEFGWSGDCSGTPRFCRDCKHKCRGSWGTNFRELVGSEIVGSGQNIPPPPPARTTVRPSNKYHISVNSFCP